MLRWGRRRMLLRVCLENCRGRREEEEGGLDTTKRSGCKNQSGRGLPHSKTLARPPAALVSPQGFGVRQSSAAFSPRR